MLSSAMLFYVGQAVNAPAWYWWCWGIYITVKILAYGVRMLNVGRKDAMRS